MTQDADRRANRVRLVTMIAVALPLVALFTILGVALTRSGGVPAGTHTDTATAARAPVR